MSAENGECPLEDFRIAGLPPDFYYIPNFISVEEEASILQKIPAHRWIALSHRRLQAHPSTLTKNNTLLAAPLPAYLTNLIISRFKELGIFDNTPHQQPNHVLINEYKPGEGIMPHEDGKSYASVVATVSLGGTVCLSLTPKPTSEDGDEKEGDKEGKWKVPTRLLQEPRSLLITTGKAYESLLHGVDAVEVDEGLNADTVANWSLLSDRTPIEEAVGRNLRSKQSTWWFGKTLMYLRGMYDLAISSDGELILQGMLIRLQDKWATCVGSSIPCPLSFSSSDRTQQQHLETSWSEGVELMHEVLTKISAYQGWDGRVNHDNYPVYKEQLAQCRENFLNRYAKTKEERSQWIQARPFEDKAFRQWAISCKDTTHQARTNNSDSNSV